MKHRLALVLLGLGLWVGAISWRLYELQVVEHDHYRDKAQRQQQRIVELDPPRGTVFDAAGRELAVSIDVESAFAVPHDVTDPEGEARQIARVLGSRTAPIVRRLRSDREFVWIARKLDPPQSDALRRLDLPGIDFLTESKRYYPQRELAAQLLGYVGTDDHGLGGLEAAYDELLAGRPVRRTVLRDARRTTVLAPGLSFSEAEPGENLYLTLDASIQHIVERELARAVSQSRARHGTAVVLDPGTGAVLAMATSPGFDPNRFGDYPEARWRNRAIADAYEPGSTFKVVPAAAALEANLFDPQDVIDCEMGGITLAGVRINDHKPFGLLTFRDVIVHSSDVGAIKIGLRAGKERLFAMTSAFGFGRLTGIDLPGESEGILRPLASWAPLTPAYVSFGQGLAVTAIQLATAFTAVANGGTLLRPFVVTEAGRGGERRVLHRAPIVAGHPVSPATARSLERLLEGVVAEGTATAAAIEGYRVAGKTGTAQVAVPGQGYSATRFIASFVGFAPARHPAVVCLVVIDEPHTSIYGGAVAAPAVAAILRQTLLYLGVPASREPLRPWDEEAAPRAQDRTLLAATTPAAPAVVPAAAVGSTPALADGAILPAATLPAAATGPVVPDLSGLTARQALVRTAGLGLALRLNGSGFVARQDPPAGTPASAAGPVVEVWLASGVAG